VAAVSAGTAVRSYLAAEGPQQKGVVRSRTHRREGTEAGQEAWVGGGSRAEAGYSVGQPGRQQQAKRCPTTTRSERHRPRFDAIWEWRPSRINRAAHDRPPRWAGVTQFHTALHRPASEAGPAGRRAAHLPSEPGRSSEASSPTKDDQSGKQGERYDHRIHTLTCCFGARGGIRTLDLRFRVAAHPSSRCHPDPFPLLRSTGSSIECVPDRRRYGRGNDQPYHAGSRSRPGVLFGDCEGPQPASSNSRQHAAPSAGVDTRSNKWSIARWDAPACRSASCAWVP
jgi:hypothetical protein